MKLKYLIENSTSEQVNERIRKIKSDSVKNDRRFLKNEVLNVLMQIKERDKK
jgi:hypothetical protein